MTHALNFRVEAVRVGDGIRVAVEEPYIVQHRPKKDGAIYRFVRVDGQPVTDKDHEAIKSCAECYPTGEAVVDNRRTA